MEQAQRNGIVSCIWGIADGVLRDLFVRDKYRDVILPMTVLLRLDVVLKEIIVDVSALEQESEGLLEEIIGEVN